MAVTVEPIFVFLLPAINNDTQQTAVQKGSTCKLVMPPNNKGQAMPSQVYYECMQSHVASVE